MISMGAGEGAIALFLLRRWLRFHFRAGVFHQKTPGQIIFLRFLPDRFCGTDFGSASAGVCAAGTTTRGLPKAPDRLPKHLTPVLVVLKHVKAGAGW